MYQKISENIQSTIVSDYKPVQLTRTEYETEKEMEESLIRQLTEENGYEKADIKTPEELKNNLRKQLELLNGTVFTDGEWVKMYNEWISNPNDSTVDKTDRFQKNYRYDMIREEDGSLKSIILVNKENIHENRVQVISQYRANEKNRYDVTILVNGLPLVHIELKKRGIPVRQAFNQIERYQTESFFHSLFDYVQIFVISNGTETKYYSNTVRMNHARRLPQAFDFTNYWADSDNHRISELTDFANTFLQKRILLNVLTKYCVFNCKKELLVMRPYQIVQAESIVRKVNTAFMQKTLGTKQAGGYIYSATGSGKTLMSFKTAQLLREDYRIDKIVFVVDRKDLDSQTIREFRNFENESVDNTTDSKKLRKLFEDDDIKLIVTTIQKLRNFVSSNRFHSSYTKNVVFIFDECHRSQFGLSHKMIAKAFRKHAMFGITGTPIYAENSETKHGVKMTTEFIFGEKLSEYSIVNSIEDGNTLPFHVEEYGTIESKSESSELISGIDTKKIMLDSRRISRNVSHIIDVYDTKTMNRRFNSLFAVQDTDYAMAYYRELKKQNEEKGTGLKIALIYTPYANEEVKDFEAEEDATPASKAFLSDAIQDYNKIFGCDYNADGKFYGYYQNVSDRVKNNEIDILIVVNMFLTGFDSKTLRVLWCDKSMNAQLMIQAFSRTNRIYNTLKQCGVIVSFRPVEKDLNEALKLYAGNSRSVVVLKTFEEYYNGYIEDGEYVPGYADDADKLLSEYRLPDFELKGNSEKQKFISLFAHLLKSMNLLSTFEDRKGWGLLSDFQLQSYTSKYVDQCHEWYRREESFLTDVNSDIVYEHELVKQFSVDTDYIMKLISDGKEGGRTEIRNRVLIAIESSEYLRPQKELIMEFLDKYLDHPEEYRGGIEAYKKDECQKAFEKIVSSLNLKNSETAGLINDCFRKQDFSISSSDITSIMLKKTSFFGSNREDQKKKMYETLEKFYSIYHDTGCILMTE